MNLQKIIDLEFNKFPKKYTEEEVNLLRAQLKEEGHSLESFFKAITGRGFFVCSSRNPIEDILQVRYSNYSINGQKYLHYMKIPYFAFISALHQKVVFEKYLDKEKLEKLKVTLCCEPVLYQYLHYYSPNPNIDYSTDPDKPRGVAFISCFFPDLMTINIDDYIRTINEEGILKSGYIYVVEDHEMVRSHKYPDMEYNCFQDIPFLARIPIFRKLDWNYETKIIVQEIKISGLHVINEIKL